MRRGLVGGIVVGTVLIGLALPGSAHFGCLIPSDDIVDPGESRTLTLEMKFLHPMEGDLMEMVQPALFGVQRDGIRTDLTDTLLARKGRGPGQTDSYTWWQTSYSLPRPGDYVFYLEPAPYWEPAEGCHIVHYTKVCVNALGLEVGWDTPVGLETEIVPLTRPYGLWTGNLFQGQVLLQGEPVPGAEIEVEYYNRDREIEPPAGPYVTQVIKADLNGVFSYAMPRAGWWGFAALNEADWTLPDPEGNPKPVELGAVYWVRTRTMK